MELDLSDSERGRDRYRSKDLDRRLRRGLRGVGFGGDGEAPAASGRSSSIPSEPLSGFGFRGSRTPVPPPLPRRRRRLQNGRSSPADSPSASGGVGTGSSDTAQNTTSGSALVADLSDATRVALIDRSNTLSRDRAASRRRWNSGDASWQLPLVIGPASCGPR
jgi:hypothetical protein